MERFKETTFILYESVSYTHLDVYKRQGIPVSEVLKRDPGYYSWIQNSDFTLNTKAVLTKIRLREMTQK